VDFQRVYKMGQSDILELLKKNPGRFFTSKDISKILGVNVNAISKGLFRLYSYNTNDNLFHVRILRVNSRHIYYCYDEKETDDALLERAEVHMYESGY
jgi:hypothetical protein